MKHLVDKTWSFLTDEKAIYDRVFAAEQRGPIDDFRHWVDAHFVIDQFLQISDISRTFRIEQWNLLVSISFCPAT